MIFQNELAINLATHLNNHLSENNRTVSESTVQRYLAKHEKFLLKAVSAGYGEGGGGRIWIYPGCILFAISLLTTLGKLFGTTEVSWCILHVHFYVGASDDFRFNLTAESYKPVQMQTQKSFNKRHYMLEKVIMVVTVVSNRHSSFMNTRSIFYRIGQQPIVS